ncbi:TusE/DsrC/DsvC family sulfur relay protein [Succinimonas sp.]|uniref:TusE/DsrC/DsvC family sulfur relay protein n=1 Tax=Succinimonas sp. TaxID=1936151 RepID=UPI002E876B2D|nr:TusE/DsrC/DsvC family sulfur relay protein [Succinimonas sp.]
MLNVNGQNLETDDNGYLKNYRDWTPEVAAKIAEDLNLPLTPERMEVVMFVRKFYEEFNTSPAIRLLVKAMAKEFGPEKGSSRYLYSLFPDGPALQAAKIAGLPRPVKCI